ncbi:MAG TPA: SprB repeat-containing protein [Cytophagales bacterium]|nr:SprB repeat-containing protein [Cytophagales bacterium]
MILKKKYPLFLGISLAILFSCEEKEKTAPNCDLLEVNAQAQPASCGSSDGSITASVSGGQEPYEFSLNGTDFQPSPAFATLASGSYMVTVRDKNSCSATANVIINENSTISASFESQLSGCDGSEGTITITSSGGQGSHLYSINDGAFQTSNSFTGLSQNTYTVTVKDEAGCTKISEVTVNSGISFATVIKPIIDGNCAVSGCHVQGGQSPNFTSFNNIKSNAAMIKIKTGDRSMPKVGSLTEQEIQQIACWVDDGALQN